MNEFIDEAYLLKYEMANLFKLCVFLTIVYIIKKNKKRLLWDLLANYRSDIVYAVLIQSLTSHQAPPPPNIVEYKTQPQLWENTQPPILSLKSPPPNIWVRTQIKILSTYSKYLR